MANGDVTNFIKRLNDVLPSWFGESKGRLEANLTGYATMHSFIYAYLQNVQLQTRIQTATGDNLDLIACDFFGDYLVRREGLTDSTFRRIIQSTLLEEMATLAGMKHAMFILTGYEPLIWEPWDAGGEAAYDIDVWGYDTGGSYGGDAPYNFWITVYVDAPINTTIGGYDDPTWGYDRTMIDDSNGAWSGLEESVLTYDDVLAVINRVKLGGTIPHLYIIYV